MRACLWLLASLWILHSHLVDATDADEIEEGSHDLANGTGEQEKAHVDLAGVLEHDPAVVVVVKLVDRRGQLVEVVAKPAWHQVVHGLFQNNRIFHNKKRQFPLLVSERLARK